MYIDGTTQPLPPLVPFYSAGDGNLCDDDQLVDVDIRKLPDCRYEGESFRFRLSCWSVGPWSRSDDFKGGVVHSLIRQHCIALLPLWMPMNPWDAKISGRYHWVAKNGMVAIDDQDWPQRLNLK